MNEQDKLLLTDEGIKQFIIGQGWILSPAKMTDMICMLKEFLAKVKQHYEQKKLTEPDRDKLVFRLKTELDCFRANKDMTTDDMMKELLGIFPNKWEMKKQVLGEVVEGLKIAGILASVDALGTVFIEGYIAPEQKRLDRPELREKILLLLNLTALVVLANTYFHITPEEAALHFVDIDDQILAIVDDYYKKLYNKDYED